MGAIYGPSSRPDPVFTRAKDKVKALILMHAYFQCQIVNLPGIFNKKEKDLDDGLDNDSSNRPCGTWDLSFFFFLWFNFILSYMTSLII